jgi:hypothetical protein
MANHARLFLLSAAAMLRHTVPQAQNRPLLDWVAEALAAGDEAEVADYLFAALPGMSSVASFRPESAFDACVALLAHDAAADLRARLVVPYPALTEDELAALTPDERVDMDLRAEQEHREQVLAAWDSPLRVLHMTGWRFLFPADVAFLMQRYQQRAGTSPLLQDYAAAWRALFAAHQSQAYDALLVLYESSACY